MSRQQNLTLFLIILALVAPTVAAQGGSGGNGELDITAPTIGQTMTVTVTGGAYAAFYLFVSSGPAFLPVPGLGIVWIDPNAPGFGLVATGNLSATGSFVLPLAIPFDPNLLSLVLFAQGAVVDLAQPSGLALTSAVRIDFESPDSFAALPDMAGPRSLGTGDRLPDGRILVAGGGGGSVVAPTGGATTDIFNPYFRSWSPGPPMNVARAFHSSATLNDGRVLVCGGAGVGGAVTAAAEIFDAATNAWTNVAPMILPRCGHSATLLNDGRVFVAGGTTTFSGPPGSLTPLADALNNSQDNGEVYSVVTNTWTPVSNTMASKRFAHTQTLLNDGRVVLVSGLNGAGNLLGVEIPAWTSTVSVYNPATNAFAAGPAIAAPRLGHRATRMPNGEVFVSGGLVPTTLFGATIGISTSNSAVKLSANAGAWTNAGTLPAGALMHGQVLLRNGKCHVSGGSSIGLAGTTISFSATDQCGTRLGGATAVTTTAALPAARGTHLAITLKDGTVLLAGGADVTATATATSILYTPGP